MAQVTNLELFKALGLPEKLYPLLGKSVELRAYLETLSGNDLFEVFSYKRDFFAPDDFILIEGALLGKIAELSLTQRWACYRQTKAGSPLRDGAQTSIQDTLAEMPHIPFRSSPFSDMLRYNAPMALTIVRKVMATTLPYQGDGEKLYTLDSLAMQTPPVSVSVCADKIWKMISAEVLVILARLDLGGAFQALGQTHGKVRQLATAELEKRLRAAPPFSLCDKEFLKQAGDSLDLYRIFAPHLTKLTLKHIVDLWQVIARQHDRLSHELANRLTELTACKIADFTIDQLVSLSISASAREELETLLPDTLQQKLEAGSALAHARYFPRILEHLRTREAQLAAVDQLLTHIASDPVITQEEADAELKKLASDERIRRIFADKAFSREWAQS